MREVEIRMAPERFSDSHTSKGNQLKWIQNGFWYKADAFGYESLSEVLCSRILMHSSLPAPVCYEPVSIVYHGRRYRGCRSKNFKGGQERLIPVERLCRLHTGLGLAQTMARFSGTADRISYMVDLVTNVTGLAEFGCYLAQLLELDAFFLNEDRHTNNIAVLYDESTGVYRLCPFFDMGLSLLADTAQDYPLGDDYEACMKRLQAKPFSRDFDEQMDAANERFGSFLKFDWNVQQMCGELMALADEGAYAQKEISRAAWVLRNQARKYTYMMP